MAWRHLPVQAHLDGFSSKCFVGILSIQGSLLQHILRLAVAKKFKHNLKLLIDINGYRERKKKALTIMAKRMADKAKRTGRKLKTDPLNPYERRIIHTLFKHNKGVTTKSEGEGHIKKVIITPTGKPYGGDRGKPRTQRGGFRGNSRGNR